jgi:hypothetical protein
MALFAGTWTGFLVDSDCYARQERNVNPFDSNFETNHDRGFSVIACRPTAKTKLFAVVDSDGQSVNLDAPGNANAVDLVKRAGSPSTLTVTVTGQKHDKTFAVDTISITK